MSHPVNDEIKENLYEEAIEEVADAFPSLPSGLAGDIAMMIAKDRWHNIDEEQSGYSPTPKTYYSKSKIDELYKWLTKSPFIHKYKIDMDGKITLTFDPKKGEQ